MEKLIKNVLYGFLGSGLFYIVTLIIKKSYVKYKNTNYERKKFNIKRDIVLILIPEFKKSRVLYFIGKILKWFFINILVIIFNIILFIVVMNTNETFNLGIINNISFITEKHIVGFLFGLSGFIMGITTKKLYEYLYSLINLLHLNYGTLERKLIKFRKKFGDKIDEETNKLIDNISDKVENNRNNNFIGDQSIQHWLSKAVEDYEKKYI